MPLKLTRRKDSPYWHYSGTVAGRRLRSSTGTADKAIAQRIAAEVETREWRSHLDGPGADLTMEAAMLNYLDAGKSDRFLVKIAEHFRGVLVRTITGEGLKRAAKTVYSGCAAATMNRQFIKPACAVINYNADLGLCQRIPAKRFPENPKTKTAATAEWVKAFAAQANAEGIPNLAALALFMFGTAARVGESCQLVWGDLDLQDRTATIRMSKPEPWERTAHLPPPVVAALANLPSNRKPDDLVFGYAGRGSVTKTWNAVAKRANLAPLTPHCCRHGFATTMLQRGFDVKTVAERGGWKDATVVLRTYAHAIEDRTVTDAVFDTDMAHDAGARRITNEKQRGNRT